VLVLVLVLVVQRLGLARILPLGVPLRGFVLFRRQRIARLRAVEELVGASCGRWEKRASAFHWLRSRRGSACEGVCAVMSVNCWSDCRWASVSCDNAESGLLLDIWRRGAGDGGDSCRLGVLCYT
jgi:hypothetical protein